VADLDLCRSAIAESSFVLAPVSADLPFEAINLPGRMDIFSGDDRLKAIVRAVRYLRPPPVNPDHPPSFVHDQLWT